MSSVPPLIINRISRSKKPAWDKVEYFRRIFPYGLKCTEWTVKWPMTHSTKRGEHKTYNPDFWCKAIKCHIEVATSLGNIIDSKLKWQKAINLGYALRVFWWTGIEITGRLRHNYKTIRDHIWRIDGMWKIPAASRENGKKGGRPRKNKEK